jgi:broad specificity phosphatase PhoE
VDGLKEQHYGWLEGKNNTLFEPEGTGHWLFRPFVRFAMAFTAESCTDYETRVCRSFDALVAENRGKRILIVVHWGVLCVLERYLSGKTMDGWFSQAGWHYCGISEFHLNDAGWQTVRLDDCRHL